jgi:DNA-binding GntR family transcriptional regulator
MSLRPTRSAAAAPAEAVRREPGKAPRKKRVPESLTQKVYERLRTEILTCALEPGADISEAELAARFKISKTPVREALATLRSEGFVRTFPRRGYQIVPVTFADMQDLFDVRTIVEAGAAELACRRITEADLTRLATLADVAYDASEQPSLKAFIRANRDFHGAIAKASGNERLFELVLRQIDALERFFYLGARLRDVSTETKSDHRSIIAALESRDPAKARDVMIRHNEVTRQGLLDSLSKAAGPQLIRL